MKIYEVTHFHGGWVSNGYPSETIVASSPEEAIEMALSKNKHWDRRNTHANEFKLKGYVIEVYDEQSYNRDKKINEVIK